MEIRVYTSDMFFLESVEDHSSVTWTRKYFEPGSFELEAPITEKNLALLQAGNIITMRGCVEAGVIEDIENDAASLQENKLIRGGRFLSSYFDRRLIKETINFSGRVEEGMFALVDSAAPLPLVRAGIKQGFLQEVRFQVTMKNLCSYLTKLALASGIGYRLRPDFREKAMYFETYMGTDRTTAQGINNRVIFSEEYANLNRLKYRYNDQAYKTFAIVGGEGEGADRVYVSVGGGSGLQLREQFVDAKDLQSEGLTPGEYREVLAQRGFEKLAECAIAENVECETGADVNFQYKVDYDLGDVVTVSKPEWGIRMDQRITEVTEVYQNGGLVVIPTLGDVLAEKLNWGD